MDIFSKFSSREKIFLYAMAIFIGAAFLDKAVILPVSSKFNQLKAEIAIEKKLLKKNVINMMQKEKVVAQHKQFENYSKPAGSDEEEMARFLNNIEKFARESAVYLADIKPRPVMKIDFYKKYIVEIESEAEMRGLTDFLYKIETADGLLNIEQLQFTPKQAGSSMIKGIIIITKILIP